MCSDYRSTQHPLWIHLLFPITNYQYEFNLLSALLHLWIIVECPSWLLEHFDYFCCYGWATGIILMLLIVRVEENKCPGRELNGQPSDLKTNMLPKSWEGQWSFRPVTPPPPRTPTTMRKQNYSICDDSIMTSVMLARVASTRLSPGTYWRYNGK